MLAVCCLLALTIQAPPVTPGTPEGGEALYRYARTRGYIRDAFFGTDSSTLTPDAQKNLTVSAEWIKNNPDFTVIIEGHTDERGSEQYNLALGDRRANTVRDYLTSLGLDPAAITITSYGEERPFDTGHDESAWGKNRRAHLVLVPSGVPTTLGAITGSVADARGVAVADAIIVIRHISGQEFVLHTFEDGTYRRSGLTPGAYAVSAAKIGFATGRKDILLAAKGHSDVLFVLVGAK